jgi:hypothetical protein
MAETRAEIPNQLRSLPVGPLELYTTSRIEEFLAEDELSTQLAQRLESAINDER